MKEDHSFIKETIKKEPLDFAGFARKTGSLAVGGIVFGICAAVSMAVFMPVAGGIMGTASVPEVQVSLSPGEEAAEEGVTPEPQNTDLSGNAETSEAALKPLEYYGNIYEEVLRVSEEPRKALVQVSAMRDGENLLDKSLLRWGDEEGIIFLCSDSNYYILTACESLLKSDYLQVTFSNGDLAKGFLCGADTRTGLAVVRVPAENLNAQTCQSISTAKLTASDSLLQAKPVIAIGSPVGDYDAVIYGMVTSASGRYSVADAEYSILSTDMKGCADGSGVLLDDHGEVVGFILPNSDESSVVRAVSVAQLRPLIETLSNGEAIRYLGIYGIGVTASRAKALQIPEGIYVESVEANSPAMKAGILSGDIITGLGDEEVDTMQDYSARLQELPVGGQTMVTLQRRNAEGLYIEMNLQVNVAGK